MSDRTIYITNGSPILSGALYDADAAEEVEFLGGCDDVVVLHGAYFDIEQVAEMCDDDNDILEVFSDHAARVRIAGKTYKVNNLQFVDYLIQGVRDRVEGR